VISRDKFVATMARILGDGEKARSIFDAFDIDNSGSIDVHEYLTLMGAVYGNSVEQKLDASFKLFDANRDGMLSREELDNMLTRTLRSWLSQASKKKVVEVPEEYKTKIKQILDQIFETIDTDKNGYIDKDEFKRGFSEHPDICAFFKQF
jgi:Ca2+-binding EF-hand superfamily protein